MAYNTKINEYGIQEEFWNYEKLPNTCSCNETEDVPIYFKIIKKYEKKDGGYENDAWLWIHEDDTVNDIKIKFLDMIKQDTNDTKKLLIINDMQIACEEWESRHLRRNIKKVLKAIVDGEIKFNKDYDDYEYNEEFTKIMDKIEKDIYHYLDLYNIQSDFGIKCMPFRNGFMEIEIYNSNRINKEQINAIERIIRGHYSYGEVKFNRDGSIENINHSFTTKYYAGRYTNR